MIHVLVAVEKNINNAAVKENKIKDILFECLFSFCDFGWRGITDIIYFYLENIALNFISFAKTKMVCYHYFVTLWRDYVI